MRLACFSATALLAICAIPPAHGRSAAALVLQQTIPLPTVHGAFNHMTVDDRHQRLFVPAPADERLEVVDLASGKPWRSIPAERPTTALYAPEPHQLYLTSGRYLFIYDGNTLERLASIDLHSRLDGIRYDARAHELFIGRMSTGETGIAIVAALERKLVTSIALPSSPQGFAIELEGPRLFVNLPDDGAVAVIDRRKHSVSTIWKLKGATDNFPMALDERDKRLFVATRTPAQMLVLSTETGQSIAEIPCVEDADDMAYDPTYRRIYISGGGGFISVIEQQGADRYALLERVQTVPDASNSTFSSQTKSLYLGVPPRNGESAEIRAYGVEP